MDMKQLAMHWKPRTQGLAAGAPAGRVSGATSLGWLTCAAASATQGVFVRERPGPAPAPKA